MMVARILDGEGTAVEELPGYVEHTQEVRYRPVPGLSWVVGWIASPKRHVNCVAARGGKLVAEKARRVAPSRPRQPDSAEDRIPSF